MTDVDSVQCSVNQPRRLHTEMIPCTYDDVVFPSASGFVVDVGSTADIRVTSVHLGIQVCDVTNHKLSITTALHHLYGIRCLSRIAFATLLHL